MAIAFHTIKRQLYGSSQLPITLLQNMIISYNNLCITPCLDHITSQHALQKQVRRTLLCLLQVLRGCYGLSKNHSYLCIKTTTIVHLVSVVLTFTRTGLAQPADLEPIPWPKKKQKKNTKTRKHRSRVMIIA